MFTSREDKRIAIYHNSIAFRISQNFNKVKPYDQLVDKHCSDIFKGL